MLTFPVLLADIGGTYARFAILPRPDADPTPILKVATAGFTGPVEAIRSYLERRRWVVERTLAWFAQFRRLAIRYERRSDIHLAFSTLAAALIVWRFIERWFC